MTEVIMPVTVDIEKVIAEEGMDEADAVWLRSQPPGAGYLVGEGMAFIGCDHQHDGNPTAENCKGKPHARILCLNMNDTFAYACGDAESVGDALDEVVNIYQQYGPVGLICWVAKQRGEDPVIEYTEDLVYQETWRTLYGDPKVAENEFNKFDPRWGEGNLCLKPWVPKTAKP